MDTVIVIMQKNLETGLLEKELASLNIENEQYILNIYAMGEAENELKLFINLTTENDVQDWEYNAIYDYYDKDVFQKFKPIINEKNEYNPTWELIIDYPNEIQNLQSILNDILSIHKNELFEVFSIIQEKKGEYENEK